jgi:hypothetical protein
MTETVRHRIYPVVGNTSMGLPLWNLELKTTKASIHLQPLRYQDFKTTPWPETNKLTPASSDSPPRMRSEMLTHEIVFTTIFIVPNEQFKIGMLC